MTTDVFIRLLEEGNDVPKDALASAPESVWLDVISRHPELHIDIIRAKCVPLAALRVLARSDDPFVRSDVARKRKLDDETFRLLAADDDDAVRASIAWNAKTPPDVLKALQNDPVDSVSEGARKPRK